MLYNSSLIKNYFNDKASSWNNNNVADEKILDLLFDKGSFIQNRSILDVGCGTGILFNYFLKHNAKSITGIDLSNKMIEIAKNNFNNINLICDDILYFNCDDKYDLIVIYNVLPHILSLDKLFINLQKLLNINGKIIIAFGQSRDMTNQFHKIVPEGISFILPSIDDLCSVVSKYFDIEYSISNEDIYEIICIK